MATAASFPHFQSKKQKKNHEPITCNIILDGGPITKQTIGNLVCEICKYLLYDREQIPFVLKNANDYLDKMECSQDSMKLQRKEKLVQMIGQLDSLFDNLLSMVQLESVFVKSVCLSLGSSLRLPKEFYCIQLPDASIYQVTHCNDCKKQSLRTAYTRFFRTVLSAYDVLFRSRSDIGTTKISLLIQLKRTHMSLLVEHLNSSPNCGNSFLTVVNDYEVPKIGNRFLFVVTQDKCDCVRNDNPDFDIYEDKSEVSMCIDQDLSQILSNSLKVESDPDEDWIWVQLGQAIQGVKNKKVSKSDILSDL